MTSRTTDGQGLPPARTPGGAPDRSAPSHPSSSSTERADHALSRLLAATAALQTSHDPTTVLQRLVDTSRELVGAGWAVAVLDDHAARPGTTVWSISDRVGSDEADGAAQLGDHVHRGRPTAPGTPTAPAGPSRSSTADGLPVLTVPLQVQGLGLGVLALAGHRGRDAFSRADEQVVALLAATAASAVHTSHVVEDSAATTAWADAAAALDRIAGGAGAGPGAFLEATVGELAGLVPSDLVAVLRPGRSHPDVLEVLAAAGPAADAVADAHLAVEGSSVRRALEEGAAFQTSAEEGLDDDLRALVPYASALVIPLTDAGSTPGAVLVARLDPAGFSATELARTQRLVDRVGLTLEAVEARDRTLQVRDQEERDRIARDLHDHVIQRLFATGLSLESIVAALPPGDLQVRADAAVEELDQTIERVQTTMTTLGETSI